MKKLICISLTLSMLMCLAACGKKDEVQNKPASSTTGVADVLTTDPSQSFDYFESNTTAAKKDTKLKKFKRDKADVELAGLNANMTYSGIYDLMTKPGEYEGKTVRISGVFSTYEDPVTEQKYFACFVADAAACCSQGLEFLLTDDYAYPADYPAENQEITVYGTFETYMEGQNKYCRLKDAVFTA